LAAAEDGYASTDAAKQVDEKTRAVLAGVDMNEAGLYGANFNEANLTDADLREARFIEVRLDGADFTGADHASRGYASKRRNL